MANGRAGEQSDATLADESRTMQQTSHDTIAAAGPTAGAHIPAAAIVVTAPLTTIAAAGLTAGVMDGTAAALFSPISAGRVFQYVASGLLGRSAFEGGGATIALGIALHFVVATLASAVYVSASRRLPVLLRRPVPGGLAYGIAVYFFMRYVVVPLSAVTTGPFSLTGMLRGIAIHLVCVGLPIALVTRWLASSRRSLEAR